MYVYSPYVITIIVVDTAVARATREGNVISGRGAKIQARLVRTKLARPTHVGAGDTNGFPAAAHESQGDGKRCVGRRGGMENLESVE